MSREPIGANLPEVKPRRRFSFFLGLFLTVHILTFPYTLKASATFKVRDFSFTRPIQTVKIAIDKFQFFYIRIKYKFLKP